MTAIKKIIIFTLMLYHRAISPFLPWSCRFYPSCSLYFIEAVKEFGVVRGTAKGLIRILKCQPLHPGGHDPVIK